MGLNFYGAEKLNLNREVKVLKTTCVCMLITLIESRQGKDSGRYTEKAQDTQICNAFHLEGFLFS